MTPLDDLVAGQLAEPGIKSLLLRASVQEFLEDEAEVLDAGRFEEWLELLSADMSYRVPIRVTRKRGTPDVDTDMFHFDDDRRSLGLRVRRLATGVAWAEDPPSRTRRFVTNIRLHRRSPYPTFAPGSEQPRGDQLEVASNLLLFRSRGDDGSHDLISAERFDTLRLEGAQWRLCRREAVIDQSTLGTKNLAVFL